MLKTRWAAIGAAIAITLGAGGISLVSATSPAGAAAFVPIEPCRLFDTRPDFNVGTRATPLGADETFTVRAHGDRGECVGIPDTATGLGLNVTAVDPSLATVLTIWGDGERPNASSLNPTPGSPPTPNAVTSDLTADGELNVWNAFGAVHVLADVVGYYTDHAHDDRYYTEDEIDAALEDAADADAVWTKVESDRRYLPVATAGDVQFDDSGAVVVGPVEIAAPTDGIVVVDVSCRVSVLGSPPNLSYAFGIETPSGSSGEGVQVEPSSNGSAVYEARRGYELAAGATATYRVFVSNDTDSASYTCESVGTVQFIPNTP